MTRGWWRWGVAVCGLIGLLTAMPAGAQDVETPQLPEVLSDAEIDAFVARLDDDGVRRLLLAELQRDAAAAEAAAAPAEGFAVTMERDADQLRRRIGEVLRSPVDEPEIIAETWRDATANGLFGFLLSVVLLIAAGVVVEGVFRRATGDVRRRIDAASGDGFVDKMCFLLLRGVLDLLSIVAFAVGGVGAFVLTESNVVARQLVAAYVAFYVALRLLSVISRFFLSPRASQLRLVAVGDGDARALHQWVLWIFGSWAFGLVTLGVLTARGISPETAIFQKGVVTLVMAGLIIALIWRRRCQVAGLIRGANDGAVGATARLRGQMADIWHIVATVYIAGIWSVNMAGFLLDRNRGPGAVLLSLGILLIVPAIDWGIGRLLTFAFQRRVEAEDGTVSVEVAPHNARSIGSIRRGVRVLLVLASIAALMAAWGFDFTKAAANPIIERVAGPLFNTLVIVVLGYVAWEVLKSAIDRRLDDEGGDPTARGGGADVEAEEGGGDPGTRLQTLLPLFRKFMISVIVVMVVLSVLASFGVNIAPLLAGAGVVGIAVGFGAQALVRDVFSGLFFLLDDAFRVGEYIEIDDKLMGTVEEISVRSMKLRHHRGALHILPFGELRSITNRTRGWVIDKLDLRVPYDTDVEKVRKIIKGIGIEMLEDSDLGPRMIAPLKSQGVYQLEDSAMILRAKYTAKPRGRAKIRREAQIRIKRAFDAAGIEFAHKQVTVHVPDGENGAAAGAAAAAALQQQEEEAAPAKA